jgi:enamine deaminase RidA (YjgF/YER057c/UK114 family)/GNAT superfamily N-acetyltransferase
MLIRKAEDADRARILAVVNDAAQAYRGVIPADQWHEPYMPLDQLEREIAQGVVFWVAEEDSRLLGVMGMQDKGAVALVRHAYVVPATQRKGVGTTLLRHVQGLARKPILIGTWADASWAIEFYRRNGFEVVPDGDRDRLLRTYWSIPERQIETSVVLADRRMARESINPRSVFASLEHGFSQAVLAGGRRTLYVSGQVAWNSQRQVIGGADLEQQARQAFTNLEAVVGAAGGTLADVVALRIYIVNYRPEDAAAVGGVLRSFFPGEIKPASTWIGVTALADPAFLVEVEATAVLD